MALKSNADIFREYPEEDDATAAFSQAIEKQMTVTKEVWLRTAGGDALRIDAVAVCKETGWPIGCELKKSHLTMSEFGKAIYQAAQYKDARITDDRLGSLVGTALPITCVFPDWRGMHDEGKVEFDREAKGMRVLASQFRVGTMKIEDHQGLILGLAENRLWSANRGWIQNAKNILYGKQQIGSQRKPRQS